MNVAQLKCLTVFAIFAIIGFGPVSPGCLIGMYIIWMRPVWFLALVDRVYNYPKQAAFVSARQCLGSRVKGFICLSALFVVDILPLPIVPVIAFVIILARPQWFYGFVRNVYGVTA
jgi:hypothetical protein